MKFNPAKHLNKAYRKKFKSLNKKFSTDKSMVLHIFTEHLKYHRDLMIIQSQNNLITKARLTPLIVAIAEFETYKKYVSTNEATQKAFHWSNFCELIKHNMEEWLDLNDSV